MMTERTKSQVVSGVCFMFGHIERLDVAQEAEVLLCQNPEMSSLRLKSRLIDVFRSKRWQDSPRRKFEYVYYGIELNEGDQPASDPEDVYADRLTVWYLFQRLFQDERELLILRFWMGMTQLEMGRAMGWSGPWTCQKLNRVLAVCRKILEGNNGSEEILNS